MSTLVNNILAYARTGKSTSDSGWFLLEDILQEKLIDLQELISRSDAKIEVDLPTHKINCFPHLIGSLFYNLINNGIKFNTSENPLIQINYIENTDSYDFTVSDNGIGIEEKYRTTVFETFKRLHRPDQFEGSGIGLSICRRVTHIHNGKIWISPNPTGGTIFHFSISKTL